MVGVSGTSPKATAQKVVWWTVAALFGLFIIYVLFKSGQNV
jgi:hypothetical protein